MLADHIFADLQGSEVSGTIPVSEALVRAALRQGLGRPVEVEILNNNRMRLGVELKIGPFSKWIRPEIALPARVPWPVVYFTIVSSHGGVGWLLELLGGRMLPPGVIVRGREIALDLEAFPMAAPYVRYLKYITQVNIEGTMERRFLIHFKVRIA